MPPDYSDTRALYHDIARAAQLNEKRARLGLISSLVAQSPPLLSTTAAVLLCIDLYGDCPFFKIARHVNIHADTLRKQLSSLSKDAGLIGSRIEKPSRRRLYRLTDQGRELIAKVQRDAQQQMQLACSLHGIEEESDE